MAMSENELSPYRYLGERLKKLRESQNESLGDVSDAVEIETSKLKSYEAGKDRPSEDVLLLLFSHFDVEEMHAVELWRLAGYEGHPEGREEPAVPPMVNTQQQAMMVMIDPRIMYSDGAEVIAGNRGVVINFSQVNGPNGQPLTVSRIGMSREQAEQLMGILHQVLYDMDNPSQPKRLGDGGGKSGNS